MTRKLGEKSYNPGTFRLNFWGDRNYYGGLCDRKLPGSILLAAYYTPMTAKALSLELGVSMPYLEDELQALEAAGLLCQTGDNYQTNLVIITAEYEKEFERQTSSVYADVANRIFTQTRELLPSIRVLDFRGNTYDDNRLLFGVLNIVMVNAYFKAKDVSPYGVAAKLPLGGHGWLFGHDNDFANLRFHGVCMEVWNKQANAWFSAENYCAIEACQRYLHPNFEEKAEAMCDAVLQKSADRSNESLPWLIENGFIISENNMLDANFPVFEQNVYSKLCELLGPVIEMVTNCMIYISDRAAKLLAMHAPAAVKAQCADIAKIHHRLAVAAFLLEHLIAEGKLIVPSEKTPLCVFGVKA